jgi:hypothetical protein
MARSLPQYSVFTSLCYYMQANKITPVSKHQSFEGTQCEGKHPFLSIDHRWWRVVSLTVQGEEILEMGLADRTAQNFTYLTCFLPVLILLMSSMHCRTTFLFLQWKDSFWGLWLTQQHTALQGFQIHMPECTVDGYALVLENPGCRNGFPKCGSSCFVLYSKYYISVVLYHRGTEASSCEHK